MFVNIINLPEGHDPDSFSKENSKDFIENTSLKEMIFSFYKN